MSTITNKNLVSEKNLSLASLQENELKDALSIVELEERFELTASAEDAVRCSIFPSDLV